MLHGAGSTRGRHVAAPRGGRTARLVKGSLLGLIGVLSLTLVLGAVVFQRLQGNITAADISDALGNLRPSSSASTDPTTNLPPMNILLMGSDNRSELADASDFGGSGGQFGGARSDTTLVVHLAADRKSATVVSIPRDSMVPMPSCTDPDASLSGASVQQFNSAFSIGGPGCTVKTVEANTGIRIDHFAVLNFDGFQQMVDALGGVEVCLTQAVKDRQSNLDLPAGTSRVRGAQALAFVRVRHGIGDGSDIGRIERQQAFLGAVVREATSSGLLLRPDRLLGFLDAATKSLTTDPEWASIKALSSVALQVKGLRTSNVQFVTVPTQPYPTDANRVQWTAAADALWESIRTDQPLPGSKPGTVKPSAGASTAPLTVSPADVPVQVLNSSGVAGFARQAAAALEAQGFPVSGTGNGTTADLRGTVVRYPTGQLDAARTLAAAFPGARTQVDTTLSSSYVVELGAGAPAVVAVSNRVGTGALPEQPLTATAAPSATPTITARTASDASCSKS